MFVTETEKQALLRRCSLSTAIWFMVWVVYGLGFLDAMMDIRVMVGVCY